jgi:hypothetical protein
VVVVWFFGLVPPPPPPLRSSTTKIVLPPPSTLVCTFTAHMDWCCMRIRIGDEGKIIYRTENKVRSQRKGEFNEYHLMD